MTLHFEYNKLADFISKEEKVWRSTKILKASTKFEENSNL